MMLESQPPTMFGDGQTSRDFTHVKKAVEANLAAAVEPAAAGRVMVRGAPPADDRVDRRAEGSP
jgi:nucleoside-diphosphate-sugar epimerase